MTLKKIFLVGLPGSGKSTIGKKIAEEFNLKFVDLDKEIADSSRSSITALFEERGEVYFRELERQLLKKVIESNASFVLATGGGTPCFFDNMDLMNESGVTIYVNTPIKEIQKRLKNDSSRPLLKKHKIEELAKSRKVWYEKAQKTISDNFSLEDLLD